MSDVIELELFFGNRKIDFEVQVQKVLSSVVVIHADIFELEVNTEVAIGEEGGKLNQLVPEVLNELIIDIGYPSLELDRHVLVKKVYALFLLQNRLNLYHVFIF